MTICTIREVTPHLGKEALAESRLRRAAGVMARHGAFTRIMGAVRLGSPSIRSLQNAQFIKRQESLTPQEWRHVHAKGLLHSSVRAEISHTA